MTNCISTDGTESCCGIALANPHTRIWEVCSPERLVWLLLHSSNNVTLKKTWTDLTVKTFLICPHEIQIYMISCWCDTVVQTCSSLLSNLFLTLITKAIFKMYCLSIHLSTCSICCRVTGLLEPLPATVGRRREISFLIRGLCTDYVIQLQTC